ALLAAARSARRVGVGHGMTGAGAGAEVAWVHMAADIVHLLCAMAWIGGLFCLVQVLRRAVLGDSAGEFLHVVLPRFSRVGYWLVTLLLISGCINALVLLPRPDSLVTSDYGRVLLVKIGLVLIMVAFALYNRLVLLAPGLDGEISPRAPLRSAPMAPR